MKKMAKKLINKEEFLKAIFGVVLERLPLQCLEFLTTSCEGGVSHLGLFFGLK